MCYFFVRNNKDTKGLNIFDHLFLYTAYDNYKYFFLGNKDSIRELAEKFDLFSSFSGLRPNIPKCETCRLGARKREDLAVCGIQSVGLTRDTIETPYAIIRCLLQNQKNYGKTISNIILELQRMKNF